VVIFLAFSAVLSAEELKDAKELFESKKFKEAVVILKKIMESDPQNPEPHLLLSKCYDQLFEIDNALKEYQLYQKLKYEQQDRRPTSITIQQGKNQKEEDNIENSEQEVIEVFKKIDEDFFKDLIEKRNAELETKTKKYLSDKIVFSILKSIPKDSEQLEKIYKKYEIKSYYQLTTSEENLFFLITKAIYLEFEIDKLEAELKNERKEGEYKTGGISVVKTEKKSEQDDSNEEKSDSAKKEQIQQAKNELKPTVSEPKEEEIPLKNETEVKNSELNKNLTEEKEKEVKASLNKVIKSYNKLKKAIAEILNTPVFVNSDPLSYDFFVLSQAEPQTVKNELNEKKATLTEALKKSEQQSMLLKKKVVSLEKELNNLKKKLKPETLNQDESELDKKTAEVVKNYLSLSEKVSDSKKELMNYLIEESVIKEALDKIGKTLANFNPKK